MGPLRNYRLKIETEWSLGQTAIWECCFFSGRQRWDVFTHMCMLSWVSHAWLSETLWIVACQAPPSVGLSRQKYWSGLPFPSPGDLPHAGMKPGSLEPPEMAGRFFTTHATWEALIAPHIINFSQVPPPPHPFLHSSYICTGYGPLLAKWFSTDGKFNLLEGGQYAIWAPTVTRHTPKKEKLNLPNKNKMPNIG